MPLHREVMDNPKASRVRMIADLSTRKARKKSQTFLVEGPQAVREVLRFCGNNVRDIYVDENFRQSEVLRTLVHEALDKEIFVHKAHERVIETISKDCQGIIAVVNSEALSTQIGDSVPHQGQLFAACWQLRDPGNAGTIIRAADACGCSALILVDDCVDVTNPKVIRASAGSLFHIPVLQMNEEEFFIWTRDIQATVTAADVYGTEEKPVMLLSDALRDIQSSENNVILFGNEARGLQAQSINKCDRAVVIPLYGNAESLNVAMSASVMLYTFAMRMHEQTLGE